MNMTTYHLSEIPMQVRAYSDRDFPEIQVWYRSRGMSAIEDCLPQFGFIAPGIAAGFLVQTDTKYCFLEPFISNPTSTIEERDEALNLIMFNLINLAKLLEFKYIFGVSRSQGMISRALRHGFVEQDISTVVRKEI
jgi:hypothetical protein